MLLLVTVKRRGKNAHGERVLRAKYSQHLYGKEYNEVFARAVSQTFFDFAGYKRLKTVLIVGKSSVELTLKRRRKIKKRTLNLLATSIEFRFEKAIQEQAWEREHAAAIETERRRRLLRSSFGLGTGKAL